ncbi:demethoxyubiquinone hydroxylase family protein [Sandaracinobacteroides saxicola]|uniref:3-demethoxyubiquinol 3-hydroxylase n=1 Tax=Sandaracinobacteroides saxicola TaxID=2759707 RepID=A0A7G5IHV4_9SPHN|nr:demethoxyubiquinone hydroxylase family protein [Sandaracinobacteroides saxicola]QMW22946.1 demethoxyubiquinone hydroxylase family protein [Sandaracinobacteroides saxicola]
MSLPGDAIPSTDAMIRVDHAGEYGAARIYAGQLAVMGDRHPVASEIARMAAQEERHLKAFDRLIVERRVRPTLLHPLWHVAGFALGAATALLGPKAAMACTAAVETEIDAHYAAQRAALGARDPALSAMIADFQADEVEHRETALAHGAAQAPGYPLMSAVIRAGCRLAIRVSEKV